MSRTLEEARHLDDETNLLAYAKQRHFECKLRNIKHNVVTLQNKCKITKSLK
jgi:hypothetical protein